MVELLISPCKEGKKVKSVDQNDYNNDSTENTLQCTLC